MQLIHTWTNKYKDSIWFEYSSYVCYINHIQKYIRLTEDSVFKNIIFQSWIIEQSLKLCTKEITNEIYTEINNKD